jgi:hypothetical protein
VQLANARFDGVRQYGVELPDTSNPVHHVEVSGGGRQRHHGRDPELLRVLAAAARVTVSARRGSPWVFTPLAEHQQQRDRLQGTGCGTLRLVQAGREPGS